jgi:hypothetical protein
VSVQLTGRNGVEPAVRVSVLSMESGYDVVETEDEELAVDPKKVN